MELELRNSVLGFAQRTRKNLEFIREARKSKHDIHLVTHLINSLLGLVVVPMERHPKHALWEVTLEELEETHWPKWTIIKDERGAASRKTWTPTRTLGRLIVHLRNATAHGRFLFGDDPESRNLSEVRVIVEDAPPRGSVNWQAEIGGEELYRFCLLLTEHIEQHLN